MSDLGRPPALPEVQSVFWLDATVLPPGDPEPSRLAVVLDVPAAASGTIAVVVRSGAGDFSRLVPVQGVLWPGAVLAPAGRLDDATFAGVRARFAR
jgi:hypothetical protein